MTNLFCTKDYSVAWRDPAKFFTVPNQVTSKLRPCDETILVDSVQMNNYLKQTGDHDGVTIQGQVEIQRVSKRGSVVSKVSR